MQNKLINKISRDDVINFVNGMCVMDAYQEIAVKSAIYPGRGTQFGLMYCALGLGEAGEVQNKVKKAFRDDNAVVLTNEGDEYYTAEFYEITDARKQQIIKELGGTLWYIAATATELGVSLSEIATANLDELCGRGERGTLSGDGDER